MVYRAMFGAVLGENRLLRSYDILGFQMWGWTSVVSLEVAGIHEVIQTFGDNTVCLCDLIAGGQAIFHSPDKGATWSKVLEATNIYDITSLSVNWTLASTSAGWYQSYTSGSSWELICAAGVGVPVGKSVLWTKFDNMLYAHTGDAIWLSDSKGAEGSWDQACDLTAIAGYMPTNMKYHSIDGYENSVLATNGYSLVNSLDQGETWPTLDLPTVIRDWQYVAPSEPIWRQVCFWYTYDPPDPTKSHWMLSTILTGTNIIRTYINRGTGIFVPVVDMNLSERHRLNKSCRLPMGVNDEESLNHLLMISGDRRILGELHHAITISRDGFEFNDLLAGETGFLKMKSSSVMDLAQAKLTEIGMGTE